MKQDELIVICTFAKEGPDIQTLFRNSLLYYIQGQLAEKTVAQIGSKDV